MSGRIAEGGQIAGLPEYLGVLLVEPQKFQSDIVRSALLSAGVDVDKITEARSAASAMECVKNSVPDIVLLELDLPDAPGEHLIRHIRERRIKAPILAVTGQGESSRVRDAVAAGVDDYLLKPVSNGQIIQRIIRHLKKAGWQGVDGKLSQRIG
jgi:DNA-binding response OmpR family regulator